MKLVGSWYFQSAKRSGLHMQTLLLAVSTLLPTCTKTLSVRGDVWTLLHYIYAFAQLMLKTWNGP